MIFLSQVATDVIEMKTNTLLNLSLVSPHLLEPKWETCHSVTSSFDIADSLSCTIQKIPDNLKMRSSQLVSARCNYKDYLQSSDSISDWPKQKRMIMGQACSGWGTKQGCFFQVWVHWHEEFTFILSPRVYANISKDGWVSAFLVCCKKSAQAHFEILYQE